MNRDRILYVVLGIALFTCATPLFGGVVPFRDDFNDAHNDGNPVLWVPGSGGTFAVEDGSFIITGEGYTASWVDGTEQTTDVSLRASVRFLEPDGTWQFGARSTGGSFYWGGILPSGEVFLGEASTTHESESTSYDPGTEDVSLRMDVNDTADGVELSLFAWGEGETMPDAPQLQFTDVTTTLASGRVGMFINQGTPASVAVRYFEAVPEPSTVLLAALALVGLSPFMRRRRRVA